MGRTAIESSMGKLRAEVGVIDSEVISAKEMEAIQIMADFDASQLPELAAAATQLEGQDAIILQMRQSDEQRRKQMMGLFLSNVASGYTKEGKLSASTAAYLGGMTIAMVANGLGNIDPVHRMKEHGAEKRQAALDKHKVMEARDRRVDAGLCPWKGLPVPRRMQMWAYEKVKAHDDKRMSDAGLRDALSADAVGSMMAALYVTTCQKAETLGNDRDELQALRMSFVESRQMLYKAAAADGISRSMVDNELLPLAFERLMCKSDGTFDSVGGWIRTGSKRTDAMPFVGEFGLEEFIDMVNKPTFADAWIAKHADGGPESYEAVVESVETVREENAITTRRQRRPSYRFGHVMTSHVRGLHGPDDLNERGDDLNVIDMAVEVDAYGNAYATDSAKERPRRRQAPNASPEAAGDDEEEIKGVRDWRYYDYDDPESSSQVPRSRNVHVECHKDLTALVEAYSEENGHCSIDEVQSAYIAVLKNYAQAPDGFYHGDWLDDPHAQQDLADMLDAFEAGGNQFDTGNPFYPDFALLCRCREMVAKDERKAMSVALLDEISMFIDEASVQQAKREQRDLTTGPLGKWVERGETAANLIRDQAIDTLQSAADLENDLFDYRSAWGSADDLKDVYPGELGMERKVEHVEEAEPAPQTVGEMRAAEMRAANKYEDGDGDGEGSSFGNGPQPELTFEQRSRDEDEDEAEDDGPSFGL